MTFPSLIRLVLAGLAFSAIAGCSETAAQQQPAPAAVSDTEAVVAALFAERDPSKPKERPDFTNETVLKLNPIVERAMTALDRHDALAPQLAAARQAGDKAAMATMLAELGQLKATADAAHTAFQAEKAALVKREEYYNPVVLAAMEQFVAEAPVEIADTIARMGQ
jgi:hypothetical protein